MGVMTVQGLSYLDKWCCLHQAQHTEDMAPSRQMAYILPHVLSHLPNRTGAGLSGAVSRRLSFTSWIRINKVSI